MRVVEPRANGVHGMHFHALAETRFVADQVAELRPAAHSPDVSENVVSRTLRARICAGQKDGAMQRDDGFAGARRTGDARRAAVVALDQLALRRMQKDGPLLPGIIEGARKFFDIRHHAEAALRIGMIEGICADGAQALPPLAATPVAKFEQRLGASAGR